MRAIFSGLAAAALLAGCSNDKDPATADASSGAATQSLAAALGSAAGFSVLAKGLQDTGLATVFDGNASYTLIAPGDDAFGKLGEAGKSLQQPEERAALAAILRGHVVPGYMTPEDIDKAIAAAGGKAVKMPTMGSGALTFSRSGEDLVITADDGTAAKVTGRPTLAGNGVAIPVDTVLVSGSDATGKASATR